MYCKFFLQIDYMIQYILLLRNLKIVVGGVSISEEDIEPLGYFPWVIKHILHYSLRYLIFPPPLPPSLLLPSWFPTSSDTLNFTVHPPVSLHLFLQAYPQCWEGSGIICYPKTFWFLPHWTRCYLPVNYPVIICWWVNSHLHR